ncbi:hypothetical protein Poly59_53350 [Rubripirellula reticaptiva]|uniref:Uncharacterized protein n=1 Tax=Rubripirellula reticaptiva TaxID=2528013 RepID=A0A5C6E9M7_9BACT|nr:hypothetical protein Poly59_53350 [Rubripirellula reticaptiva]
MVRRECIPINDLGRANDHTTFGNVPSVDPLPVMYQFVCKRVKVGCQGVVTIACRARPTVVASRDPDVGFNVRLPWSEKRSGRGCPVHCREFSVRREVDRTTNGKRVGSPKPSREANDCVANVG